MSQQGSNLPMDVEGSRLVDGVGSAGMAGSGSRSELASPAISPPHDVEEIDDDSDTSPDEAMLGAEGLADVAGFISSYSTSSVKLALASKDISGDGSDPSSPLAMPASDSNAGSKPASLMVSLAHAGGNNNDDVSKPASPTHVFGAGEGDKGEGNDGLARDDVAGDSGGVAGSNSKSIKNSSDGGDVQDDVVKDAPTIAVGDGGSDSGKGKGKRVEAVGDHVLHIWTERDRRKKMKSVSNSVHSLLPRLPPKGDKASIVGESVDYIKALEDTLHGLERLKLRADAWSAPNITMRITGNESFISVCAPRLPGVVTKALCVLEKYLIDVVKLQIISCDQNRIIFFIDTCINATSAEITEGGMTAEDRYRSFVSELMHYIAKREECCSYMDNPHPVL